MDYDIKLGKTRRNTWRTLIWRLSNGLIIVGGSGSGKSQTACNYATRFALKGVKILLGEYSAYSPTGEGLADRCKHLSPAFYLPPAQTAEDVIDYIYRLHDLAKLRLDPKTGPYVDHFPIVYFIDEFSAIMLQYGNEVPVDKLRTMAMTIRKANMKLVIMGQSWAMLGNAVPQLRKTFDHTIIHRVSPDTAKLFGVSSDIARQIGNLQPGWAYKDGGLMYVPSKLSGDNLETARKRIAEIHNDDTRLLQALLSPATVSDRQTEHTNTIENTHTTSGLSVSIDTKEDLIRFLHQQGKGYSEIRDLVKGDNNTLRSIYDKVINEI